MWQYNYSPSNGNDFLAHAGQGGKGFKYVRKYRGKNGKWVYVYKNSKGTTKKIHDSDRLLTDNVTRETVSIGNHKYGYTDIHRSKLSKAISDRKFKKKAKKAAKPTAKSIAKAVGKSSKAITKRYKTYEEYGYVPKKVEREKKYKRIW